ncbi:hypothetical protein N7G274_010926 [Stereocaulon virgatum]|uniref:Uncharacterized protein n=1 Tax=Stereocaulon virgatum TaxID=373712 RepID=A0ABR3ZSP8_9LECA
MGRNDVSPAELLERDTANGYKQGAHQEEDSKRDSTKSVKNTLRYQDIASRRNENKWVIAVEKKKQDTRESLSGDDAAVNVPYTMRARSLQKGLPPLDLATIKDFLRFIIATSRGIVEDGQKTLTVDSINTVAE